MAYTNANWTCISSSLNQGQLTVTPFGGSPTVMNAPNVFVYGSPNDAVATIIAADYFLTKIDELKVGDIILGFGTDAAFAVTVDTNDGVTITVVSMGLTTAIGTANIVDAAVTTAKIADLNVTTGKLADNAVTSAKLDAAVLQYATAAITAAQFNGMYAAPKLIVAAPGANKIILLERAALVMTFVSAAYANGGAVAFQLDSTVHGAGPLASNAQKAADFTGAAASDVFMFNGAAGDDSDILFTAGVNKGLYLSNLTAAFDTGDSTFVAHVWYKVVPTV
jgi:hypothetical protein